MRLPLRAPAIGLAFVLLACGAGDGARLDEDGRPIRTEDEEAPASADETEELEGSHIRFEPERSFVDGPVSVRLEAEGSAGGLRYTLDGSRPGPAHGQVYDEPIELDRSTVLRAVVIDGDRSLSRVFSHSYLMPASVLDQPARPEGMPETWGQYGDGPVAADYAMDPRVTARAERRAAIERSLEQLPSLSIALPIEDLFGSESGIYSHPLERGRDWEREASIELIDPRGEEAGFQVDAGLRVHGNVSRYPDQSAKHSLRLRFRGDYGAGKLRYPLYGPDGPEEIESLVLRAMVNDSVLLDPRWAQYLRDAWLRETEREMGLEAVQGRYVHLFLNGLYWGLYDLIERVDEDWAAQRYGGDDEDYAIISDNSEEALDPDPSWAWTNLLELAAEGLEDEVRYRRAAAQLDLEDFIDHWIAGQYAARSDWPATNWVVLSAREPEGPVRMVAWDAEAALLETALDRSTTATEGTPAQLYSRLRRNPDFQARFDARLRWHLGPEGALHVDPDQEAWDPDHPERNRPAARYASLAAEIEDAVVAESARWSDWRDPQMPPHDLDEHWIPARDFVMGSFFSERVEVFLAQMRERELYTGSIDGR